MNFWDLFWPMFSAILATAILMELVQLVLGLLIARKQAAHYRKMQEEMLRLYPNGVPPQDIGFGTFGMPMLPPMGGKPSDGTPPADSGQYL